MKRLTCMLTAVALLGALALPAYAQAGKDCAPIGALPGYPPAQGSAGEHKVRNYVETTFDTDKGKVQVAGKLCEQVYGLKQGAQEMSELERQMNYRSQLEQLGATIVRSDDSHVTAKLDKDGHATWVAIWLWNSQSTVTVVTETPFQQAFIDKPSGADYPPLGHLPGYEVTGTPKKTHFDQATFTVDEAKGNTRNVKVQGGRYQVTYELKKGVNPYSNEEVIKNYVNALKKLGGEILHADSDHLDARLDQDGQPVWVGLWLSNNQIQMNVIEEKAFQASIKPPQASELKAALDKDGHVALYINFDFNKASLRPDAAPVIAQVLALLKDNPDLKLSIVGNTDNVGGHDYNVKLSQERAAAVAATLVKDGIGADRLKSSGDGPDKPIADNADSAGRAKNRRVELVKA